MIKLVVSNKFYLKFRNPQEMEDLPGVVHNLVHDCVYEHLHKHA